MEVKLIRGTEDPERIVAEAARNDYRAEGVIGHSFEELMEDVDPDPAIVGEAFDDLGYSRGAFANRDDTTGPEVEEQVDVVRDNGRVMQEAKKRTLLSHLMDSGHWGPFEHPQATVAINGVTRALMAQVTRHRHFTFDIMSMRYVKIDADDREATFQYPKFLDEGEAVSREGVSEVDTVNAESIYDSAYKQSAGHYEALLNEGVPPEEARKVLPMGTKVNIVMSGSARAWLHVLNVRTKGNVQGETRRCAEAIFEELKEWMPYTFEKYDEDILPLRLNP